MAVFWLGNGRSLQPDGGHTQPLFSRQRNWLGIRTRKQHDGTDFQDRSSGKSVMERVESDKSQGRICI